MENGVREISNAVMIDFLNIIIQQESRKLEEDKNTGLIAKTQQPLKENENTFTLNSISDSHNHSDKIEKLVNSFSQSPSYYSTKNNNNSIDTKHNQALIEKTSTKAHNKFDNCKVLLHKEKNSNLISPDIKVKRNVRFGEYSPLNPANQVNSQPFLGIGEYDDKRKKLLEAQRKDYVEYLSKAKKDKSISDLPKLPAYSCEEAFKTAMMNEEKNNSEQMNMINKAIHNQEDTLKLTQFSDGVESCASDDERKKETHRFKQELYRLELSKQIEEKKKLDLDRKRKEQMEDEAIERAAREQEEKIKKEFEREAEKRALAQLQKELQQEKLKNEIMQKQKDLETKSWNVPTETVTQQALKHPQSRHESLEDDNVEDVNCPPQSPFDNEPLPTTRIRPPRKIAYEEEDEHVKTVNKNTRDVSCNTDSFKNPCMNQNGSPPETRKKMEKARVTYTREPPLEKNEYRPVAVLPVTKSVIIDSPLTLALAGSNDCDEDINSCGSNESADNQISEENFVNKLLTDKQLLLSNLKNIRKQMDIDHHRMKQQIRNSQHS